MVLRLLQLKSFEAGTFQILFELIKSHVISSI